MIMKGTLERIGGATVSGDSETINALEISGHREIRNVNGKSYIMDHLRSSMGREVVVGLAGSRVLVALKCNGRTYSETGIKTVLNAGGALLAIVFVTSVVCFLWPLSIAIYLFNRFRVQSIAARVERA